MLLAGAPSRAAVALLVTLSACAEPDGVAALGRAAEPESAAQSDWRIVQAGDVNGDGRLDALWLNPSRNQFAFWVLQGPELWEPGPPIPGPPGGGWVTPNDADFNGDGFVDVLWDHASSNEIRVYLMRGTRLLEPGPEIPGPPGDGWIVPTAGDVDGDGMSDIFSYNNHAPTRMALWLMRGTHLVAPGREMPGPP
jgi:hypothetical protein